MDAPETIVALSSAPGRAGIAVIRCSGVAVRFVVETIAGVIPKARLATFLTLRTKSGEAIDQAVVIYFAAPRSFTGEDLVEFHVHGSPAVAQLLISTIMSVAPGIRLATPGEFTRRALGAGKLSLAQVEATIDLIDSDTEWQRKQAMAQLGGVLEDAAQRWRGAILEARKLAEAGIDFADEGDVPDSAGLLVSDAVVAILPELQAALDAAHMGERLREGFVVVLAGPPNAGKSSLLNAIAKRDVAIVSSIPGTTRDLIEVKLDLDGLPVLLVDTAGLHESYDEIEQLGMARTRKQLKRADLVLWLSPSDSPPVERPTLHTHSIEVQTKSDLSSFVRPDSVAVSVLTQDGVESLLMVVRDQLVGSERPEASLISRERHRVAVTEALFHLRRATSPDIELAELAAEDLRLAASALERLIGKMDSGDVLDAVFASFCIGK